jgi:hypothetical protein
VGRTKDGPDGRSALANGGGARQGKGKPRGKAFTKNNEQGIATRFKAGVSGNPKGRSSEEQRAAAFLSKALFERLPQIASKAGLHKRGRTFTQKVADVWIEQALDGNVGAIVAMANRIEGCPATSVAVSGTEDPLAILLGMMHEESGRLGRPEGFVERKQLSERNDGHD